MSSVAARLAEVRARIAAACAASGRDPSSVSLVAVSKFHDVSAMREAYAAGQRVFGENYAQELHEKRHALADLPGIELHFIGALQRNKLKLLVPEADVIETLASLDTARALSKRLVERARTMRVLVQVNVSGEPQKAGVAPAALAPLVEGISALPGLALEGLMTIPEADAPDAARAAYAELRALAGRHGLGTLSMGMSDDLEIAIAEGATTVRVGTAIFGPRPAKP